MKNKTELQETAERLLKAHGKKQVFATTDGNFFFMKNDANLHNATLKTDENPEPELFEFNATETPVVELPAATDAPPAEAKPEEAKTDAPPADAKPEEVKTDAPPADAKPEEVKTDAQPAEAKTDAATAPKRR